MIVIVLILILSIAIVIIAWSSDIKMLEDRIEELTEKLEQYENTKTYSTGAVPVQLQSERPLQAIQKGDKSK
nr:MAG TPA: Maltoporin periplasmic N-terminal extension [Caudoviricetes sp.]